MTRGLPLFLACCFLPAFLYATQPDRFLGLALIGLFAALVVLTPPKRRPVQPSNRRRVSRDWGEGSGS